MSKHRTKVTKPKGWAWGECSCGWRGRARTTVIWPNGKRTANPERERIAIERAEKDNAKHRQRAGGKPTPCKPLSRGQGERD